MGEPWAQRLQRRAMSVPIMLAATVVAVVGFPFFVFAAVVADVARGRFRLPLLRVYLFGLQYVINDSVEIVLAPLLWLAAGFGTRLRSAGSIGRHERLQWWSLKLLQKRADQLLGMRVEIDGVSEAALTPGPVIVLGRHVSIFDASLPAIVYQSRDHHVRGVVMAELLADPGFDLIYGRLGSVFIPRHDGPKALAQVRRMTEGATADTAFVVFPEGRLFRPEVRDRGLARLAKSDPERADRLQGLEQVLAARPGGVLALLEAEPNADVVVLDHAGLEPFPRLTDVIDAVPLQEPIRVFAHRIPRAEVPLERQERIDWLDELWLELDRSVTDRQATS